HGLPIRPVQHPKLTLRGASNINARFFKYGPSRSLAPFQTLKPCGLRVTLWCDESRFSWPSLPYLTRADGGGQSSEVKRRNAPSGSLRAAIYGSPITMFGL